MSSDLVDILSKMLEFNPYFRPTAKELMKHPVFNNIRNKYEVLAPHKVVVDIDQN